MRTLRQQENLVTLKSQNISIFEIGNNGEEMLKTWKVLKREGAIVSLKEFPMLDLYQLVYEDKELIELILEFIILTENHKKKIAKEKQAKGIAAARKRGIKLGRRALVIPNNFEEIYQRVKNKEISMTAATRILNVDYKTLKKWAQQVSK